MAGLAVSKDAEADGVLWVTDDCHPHESANGTVSDECAFFMQTVSTTAEVLSQPAPCSYGMGFSLDPADPSDPTGPTFVKSYYPTACADLWSDLLTGQVINLSYVTEPGIIPICLCDSVYKRQPGNLKLASPGLVCLEYFAWQWCS